MYSSPASFAGRLDLISEGKGNSAVRLEAGLDFGANVHPGLHHRAILNRAAKGAALLWDGTANLDSLAACCVSTMQFRIASGSGVCHWKWAIGNFYV
ncbi:MAG: hypothetical protein DMG61_22055 [Acidobacteria bacterium]|nr:MAG: hypothetical protein DMG61_22055 [Acidobacteriota bacterium]